MDKYQIEESIYEEQDFGIKKPDFSFDKFFQEQIKREKIFNKQCGGKKVNYEYQEIGIKMQEWFGQNIWWIFSRTEAELNKVREAFEICRKKNIKKVGYLIGILKK